MSAARDINADLMPVKLDLQGSGANCNVSATVDVLSYMPPAHPGRCQ